jgi:hypothetical protein
MYRSIDMIIFIMQGSECHLIEKNSRNAENSDKFHVKCSKFLNAYMYNLILFEKHMNIHLNNRVIFSQ